MSHAEKRGQHVVDNPAQMQNLMDEPDHHHRGDEMRQIRDGLNGALVFRAPDLVQEKREDDRCRKAGDQRVETQNHRVLDDPKRVRVYQELLEIFKTDPLTGPESGERVKSLEGDSNTLLNSLSLSRLFSSTSLLFSSLNPK